MTNVRQFSEQKPRVGRVCIVECEDGRVVVATSSRNFMNGFRADMMGAHFAIGSAPVRWCYVSDVFPGEP